ncbi:MAG: MMPL family transporter [Sulfurimonas sp.]|nr:MMPL family transporter [Sulfurimonas sp.]
MLKRMYQNYLFKYPKIIIFIIIIFTVLMAVFALRLEIDASSETLLLKGDKDLEFLREVSKQFETSDFLVVTYSVEDDLLSDANIQNIENLTQKIDSLEVVESINTILNVPLLESSTKPLKELLKDIPTLKSKYVDKKLAKKEFLNGAIYKQNLVSDDFKTTAISINLKRDEKYFSLIKNRDSFIKLKNKRNLTDMEIKEFENAKIKLKQYRDISREHTHLNIVKIRKIINQFEQNHQNIKLHLGGVDMIADDMIEFVKYDVKTFGMMIVGLLIIILYILFRELKWIFTPLFICTVSIIITSGFLGLFGWEITVVSSNFISLQLIMNLSLVVHLIIKYKELSRKNKNLEQKDLILNTMLSMSKPSFFVVITTVAGFSSLVFSNILPVINFGWMMSMGVVISLVTTFLLFPIVLLFFTRNTAGKTEKKDIPFTSKVANIVYSYQKTILVGTILIIIFSVSGAFKIKVENSFIDYFKKDTSIYQGMELLDKKLGGTTPLDIILTFKENNNEIVSVKVIENDTDEELDEFSDEFESNEEDKEKYWFTASKMEKIKEIHNYLDSLEPIGKVLSLATVGEIIKSLNDGDEADSFMLTLLNKELPKEFKKIILTPYVNIKNNQARISTRIIDSLPSLERNKLLKKIDKDLKKIINPKYAEFRISNLLVIYNNMLQSLFNSQIKTIGVVIVILFIIFLILFQNLKIATIAIVANVVPVGVVFGFMGWMGISLDMMTITIAAISLGIAVDDTIHYLHRFKQEYKDTNDYKISMFNTHGSIGVAMFYTSTIIMVGFSILVFSNFVPTIHFGLLITLAMFMAIAADLLLLPVLLLLFGI